MNRSSVSPHSEGESTVFSRQGIQGVQNEIRDDLQNLCSKNSRHGRPLKSGVDGYAASRDLVSVQFQSGFCDGHQIPILGLGLRAMICQGLTCHLAEDGKLLLDNPHVFRDQGGIVLAGLSEIYEIGDGFERIIDLVHQRPSQAAGQSHPLALLESLFHLPKSLLKVRLARLIHE